MRGYTLSCRAHECSVAARPAPPRPRSCCAVRLACPVVTIVQVVVRVAERAWGDFTLAIAYTSVVLHARAPLNSKTRGGAGEGRGARVL